MSVPLQFDREGSRSAQRCSKRGDTLEDLNVDEQESPYKTPIQADNYCSSQSDSVDNLRVGVNLTREDSEAVQSPQYFRRRASLDHSPPRFVTPEDIKALEAAASASASPSASRADGMSITSAEGGILDFASSSVVVIDTKAVRKASTNISSAYRKRSLSLSPGLGSRSEASSDGSLQRSQGNGLYTWVRTSIRKRRLRKKVKKSLNQNQESCESSKGEFLSSIPYSVTAPQKSDPIPSTSSDTGVTCDHLLHGAKCYCSNQECGEGDGKCNDRTVASGSPEVPSAPFSTSPSSPTHVQGCASGGDIYVNHRNGHVTLIKARTIHQALSQKHKHSLSPSETTSSDKNHGFCHHNGNYYNYVTVPTQRNRSNTRARSTSASRRVLLSTSQIKTKKGKKKHRVLGGAWGLFHCAGAGARSRSCTPERNINYRVRSRSATPERLINVRINGNGATGPLGGKSGGKKQVSKKSKKMKGRSKSKSKTTRRRVSVSSEDDNKENIYDMWGFIKSRILEGTPSKKSYACDRLSRIDTLNRPRGSVNINRDMGEVDFSDSEFQTFPKEITNTAHLPLRSQSERRYCHKTAPLPVDTQTVIEKAPPADFNFNQSCSIPMSSFVNGEVYRHPNSATSQTSVTSSSASSTSDYGSCKGSVISVGSIKKGSLRYSSRNQSAPPIKNRANTLPARYRDRPLPPIPTADSAKNETQFSPQPSPTDSLPPKPLEAGPVQLVKTIKLDKIMKNKWISAVAVTRKHELIVVDLREAYLLDAEGNLKRTIGASSNSRSSTGSLKEPIDVCVMANGNLLFSDHCDQSVKIYTTKGHFVRKVMDRCLANIAGVATSNKKIFIAGTEKRCITVHSEEDGLLYSIPGKDSSLCKEITSCSSSSKETTPSGKAMFEHPYSIAVNPLTGDIIVGDDYRQRVIAVSQDGRVLWRYSPTGDRHFFPCSIAVDNEGYIFIADLYNEKIYMLDSSGKPLKVILSRCEGLKGGPGALAVDGRGHLIVADEERTLKVFKYGHKGFTMYRRISMCPEHR